MMPRKKPNNLNHLFAGCPGISEPTTPGTLAASAAAHDLLKTWHAMLDNEHIVTQRVLLRDIDDTVSALMILRQHILAGGKESALRGLRVLKNEPAKPQDQAVD